MNVGTSPASIYLIMDKLLSFSQPQLPHFKTGTITAAASKGYCEEQRLYTNGDPLSDVHYMPTSVRSTLKQILTQFSSTYKKRLGNRELKQFALVLQLINFGSGIQTQVCLAPITITLLEIAKCFANVISM